VPVLLQVPEQQVLPPGLLGPQPACGLRSLILQLFRRWT
jgi:hypothetical protein